MEQIQEQGAIVFRLNEDEVWNLCKPGAGPDTCIWLMAGTDGLTCNYLSRPSALCRQWRNDKTVAKRNGCELMHRKKIEIKEVEAHSLDEFINR